MNCDNVIVRGTILCHSVHIASNPTLRTLADLVIGNLYGGVTLQGKTIAYAECHIDAELTCKP